MSERDHFDNELKLFFDRSGRTMPTPMLLYKPVDLYLMFKSVQERGGYDTVNAAKAWKFVCMDCTGSNSYSTNTGYYTRMTYEKCLREFVKTYEPSGVPEAPIARSETQPYTLNRVYTPASAGRPRGSGRGRGRAGRPRGRGRGGSTFVGYARYIRRNRDASVDNSSSAEESDESDLEESPEDASLDLETFLMTIQEKALQQVDQENQGEEGVSLNIYQKEFRRCLKRLVRIERSMGAGQAWFTDFHKRTMRRRRGDLQIVETLVPSSVGSDETHTIKCHVDEDEEKQLKRFLRFQSRRKRAVDEAEQSSEAEGSPEDETDPEHFAEQDDDLDQESELGGEENAEEDMKQSGPESDAELLMEGKMSLKKKNLSPASQPSDISSASQYVEEEEIMSSGRQGLKVAPMMLSESSHGVTDTDDSSASAPVKRKRGRPKRVNA